MLQFIRLDSIIKILSMFPYYELYDRYNISGNLNIMLA